MDDINTDVTATLLSYLNTITKIGDDIKTAIPDLQQRRHSYK